jgi:hypothetical protein
MTAAFRKGRLMRALLELLAASPDGVQARDAITAVHGKVDLTPEEEGTFEQSGAERFPKLLRFATIRWPALGGCKRAMACGQSRRRA